MFLGDMRVPLRSRDRCVTQELLDYANVRAVPQKQRRNGVPQHVWCHMPLYPSFEPQLGNDLCYALGRKPFPGSIQKQCRTAGLQFRPGRKMILLDLKSLFIYCKCQAVTASFAFDSEHSFLHDEIFDVQ